MVSVKENDFNWTCRVTWKQSARNTFWCLVGCTIGDFGTILAFQLLSPTSPVMLVMGLAMVNGILTSIALETIILMKSMSLSQAFKTAIGMSLVSMIAMETAMNLTDYLLVGKAALTWWSIAPSLLAGFLTPWPYNYWRLKKFAKSCH